jgi:hypothetical protein
MTALLDPAIAEVDDVRFASSVPMASVQQAVHQDAMRSLRCSDFLQTVLHLGGKPFSIKEYPYLIDIYDLFYPEILMLTARQVAKSTLLASKMAGNALVMPGGSQIMVSPLHDQACVFSMQRLLDFLDGSPFVKESIFSGPDTVNQVLRKRCTNGHQITIGYAQRDADRLRGQSIKGARNQGPNDPGPFMGFDEVQDILPEVIPVVKELAFRAKNPQYWYTGTPKSTNNHVEGMRAHSTAREWAVKCHHTGCGYWNMKWDRSNIGDTGIICSKCGGKLNTDRGEWVPRRKLDLHRGRAAQVTMESFRIPQLIVKPIMDDPFKYRELLDKQSRYPEEKFDNEVLGLATESGSQPVTREQVLRCCDPNRKNVVPNGKAPGMPPLFMGVDWAFHGLDSRTFVIIGGWNPFPKMLDIYFAKAFVGAESNTKYQVQWIKDNFRKAYCRIMGADWGAGHHQNLELIDEFTEQQVMQIWYPGMQGAGASGRRARYDMPTRKWHMARTRTMTDIFRAIKKGWARFPRAEESEDLIKDILAISAEFNEKTQLLHYVHVDPDDGMHALNFGSLAGEYYMRGDFRGVTAS